MTLPSRLAHITSTNVGRSPLSRRAIGLGLAATFALAACASTATSSSPSAEASVASTAPSPAGVSVGPSGGSPAGQTDTEWGRIWDTLPSDFPKITGSTPSDEASTGPASATLVVNGDTAKAIATSLQAKLETAGFATVGLSGPLEDGTYVLDSAGATAGCKVQVTAKPLGSVTTVTILYGAACPHG
jgi:hypothetical protein